jgi:hypothetical protein
MAAHAVQKHEIEKVVAEATGEQYTASASVNAEGVPDFCGIYRASIRPILLAVIAFLRLFKKAWAEAIATAVAFLDGVCPA